MKNFLYSEEISKRAFKPWEVTELSVCADNSVIILRLGKVIDCEEVIEWIKNNGIIRGESFDFEFVKKVCFEWLAIGVNKISECSENEVKYEDSAGEYVLRWGKEEIVGRFVTIEIVEYEVFFGKISFRITREYSVALIEFFV